MKLTHAVAATALLALAATCACSPADPPFIHHTTTVSGSLELTASDDPETASFMTELDDRYSCLCIGGFPDIVSDSAVVVRGPGNKVIATDHLGTESPLTSRLARTAKFPPPAGSTSA